MKSKAIITAITYVMAAMGLLSASLVTEIGPVFLILAAAFTVLSLVIKGRPERLKAIWKISAIALFIIFTIDYLLYGQDLMGSAGRFLTILAAIKLFDLKVSRDYLIFYSLVFFQIIAAAASTISPLFLLIISVFIICSIWAMIVFNIKGEFESRYRDKRDLPVDLFTLSFFLTTIALTISAMIITLALFFIIPRVGVGLMDNKNISGLKVSGFSDKIDLGEFGAVKRDTTIVMRVELPEGLPQGKALYFRGQTLDKYNPYGWEASSRKTRRIWKKSNDRYVLGHVKEIGNSMIVQNIMLEPLDTDVIFGASRLMLIEGKFSTLWTNNSGALYLPNIPYRRIEYTAISSIDTQVTEVSGGEIDYLATDELSAQVIKLAKDLTKGLGTDHEKAEKIEEYLKSAYSYSLDPGKGQGISPLDDFLFYTKKGYCEHFATALTMLLRATGIPARIVTGFLHGEWNEYGSYLLVRQQDAHSWVEAEIDGYWSRFDATPSAGLTGLSESSAFTMYLDALRFKWRRYIIKYSLSDQLKTARRIESRTKNVAAALRELTISIKDIFSGKKRLSIRSLSKRTQWPTVALVILIFAFAVFITLKRRASIKKSRKRGPAFYQHMERSLKKAGLERRPAETAMDFALRSGNENVVIITTAFESVRYGDMKLSKRERALIEERLKKLKAS